MGNCYLTDLSDAEWECLQLPVPELPTGEDARLSYLWLEAGFEGRGRRWAQEAMGMSVEVVRKPPKPVPEEVAKRWAREWAKEGTKVDWQRLMPPRGYVALTPQGAWWSEPSPRG
jgi:hypothetical protein